MSWLLSQAADLGYEMREEELKKLLKPVAESMAAVSAVVLPDELEPLFP